MAVLRFLATGYASEGRQGPLSITAVTDDGLTVVDVPFKAHDVSARLARGEPLDAILAGLSSLRKSETRIPAACIRSIRWITSERDFRIEYVDDRGRTRHKTSQVSRNDHRAELIAQLERLLGHRFREQQVPAGVLRLAWAQLLGAVLSVFGTLFIVLFWDPRVIAGAKGGIIVLWLGPTGCALVGAGFLVACLIAAWRRLSPRPTEHRWTV